MARRAAKLCVVFQSLWGRWPCSCFDNRVVRGVNEALLGGTLAVLRWMRPSRRLRTCPGSTLARVAPPSSQRCQVSAQIARRRSVVVCLRVSLDLISAASAPPVPSTRHSILPRPRTQGPPSTSATPSSPRLSTPTHAPAICISTARPPPHNGNARSNQRCKSISCVQLTSLPVF